MPLSRGSIGHRQEQRSQAWAGAHAEALDAVRAAQIKHAEQTRGSQASQRRWLGLAATAPVAAFVVHARRRRAGLPALRGEILTGIVLSDRWSVYEGLPSGRRQVCWAQRSRDFRALSERRGTSRRLGEDLGALSAVLLA